MLTDSEARPVQITEEEGGRTHNDGDQNSNSPQSDVVDSSVRSEDQDSEYEDHVFGGSATFVRYGNHDSSDSDMAIAATRNHTFARFCLINSCFDSISNQQFQLF